MRDRFCLPALGLALAVMAGACDFNLDETANRFPDARVAEPDAAPPPPDVGPPCEPTDGAADCAVPPACEVPAETCDCIAVGEWYRFTSLFPTSLGGDMRHPLVLTLKNLWATDINRFELNVMFQVTAIEGDRLTVLAMNAARGELDTGEVCTLPETIEELYFVRDPCDPCIVRMERPQQIHIYAGTPEIPRNCAPALPTRHAIPVTRIQLEARISPDCSTLSDGRATGAGIPAPDLARICTCPGTNGPVENCEPIDPAHAGGGCDGCNRNFQNLETLMVALNGGRPMATECPGDDGVPGVCIDASFTAARFAGETPICGEERITRP